MVDWVRAVYFYCHLIGLSNFEFDWRTGRVFTSWRGTLYFITTNFAIFSGLVYCWTNLYVNFKNANKLYSATVLSFMCLRIMAGAFTVLSRWYRRTQIMRITRTLIRLNLASPNIMRFFRRRIYLKILTGFATALFQIVQLVDELNRLGYAQVFLLALQFWAACILNLVLSQNSLLMLFVRAQYHIVNTKLRKVIEESRSLSRLPHRRAFIMTRCCDLADQVDNIAKLRSELQSIISQLGEVFGIQWVLGFCDNYLWSVYFFYLIYTFFKYDQVKTNSLTRAFILGFISCIFYYVDVFVNLSIMLNVLDDDKEIWRQAAERTLFGSVLDVRLEQSLESLQLQIVRSPVEITVMKLFPVNRIYRTAMLGSIITHSIVLIQYDIENY